MITLNSIRMYVFISVTWRRQSWSNFAFCLPFQWRHNELDGVWNHRRLGCLLNRLFRRRSKKTSKLRVTGLCEGNSPVTSEFPAQRASNAENVSIWWRHHALAALDIVSEAFQPLRELPPGRLAETVLVLTTDFGLILYETKNCEVFIHMRGEYIHYICKCFHPCRAGTELIWSNIVKYHGCWCLAPSVTRTSAPMILTMQIR